MSIYSDIQTFADGNIPRILKRMRYVLYTVDVASATTLPMSKYGIAEVSGEKEKRITGLARKQSSGTVPAPRSLPYSLPSAVGKKVIYNFGLTNTLIRLQ